MKKAERQAEYERRLRARVLLFEVGGGSIKKLPPADAKFVRMVRDEAYQAYLTEHRTGVGRFQGWSKSRRVTRSNEHPPMALVRYHAVWFGSQKKRWIHHDLPKRMNGNSAL